MKNYEDGPTFELIRKHNRHMALPNVSKYPTCCGKVAMSKRRSNNTKEILVRTGQAAHL
jgi:hypothetical protein